jgi:hypothetical protein
LAPQNPDRRQRSSVAIAAAWPLEHQFAHETVICYRQMHGVKLHVTGSEKARR